jgi:hypothetical protein
MRQLGNAVPVRMAEAVALKLRETIRQSDFAMGLVRSHARGIGGRRKA